MEARAWSSGSGFLPGPGHLLALGNTRPFPKPPSLHLKKETPDNGIPLSGLLSELSDRQTQSVCTVPGTHQRCSPDAGSPHVLPWEGRSQQLTVTDVDVDRDSDGPPLRFSNSSLIPKQGLEPHL